MKNFLCFPSGRLPNIGGFLLVGEGEDLSALVVGTAAEAVTVLWAGRGSMPL